jgi:transposase
VIENRPEAVRRLIGKLGKASTLRVCYEAGPTGYVLYWQLTKLGVHCEVIAPSLVPTKPGGPRQNRSARRREARARLSQR